MNESFSVFRKYPTLGQVKELEVLLHEHEIVTQITDNIAPIDSSFTGSMAQNQYELKISIVDFEKAEKVLEDHAENSLIEVGEDHYLFGFSDDELYEILLKSDEWSELDYMLARKILTQRGKAIDTELLKALKRQRLELLAKPDENQKPWIIAGYIFAFFGGLLGLFIGYSLWTSKKTLPNGQKVYSYTEHDRAQGKTIFYLGLLVLVFYIIVRIMLSV